MPNTNKDNKVVDRLYEENQNLYTRLGEVYDDYIKYLDWVIEFIDVIPKDVMKEKLENKIKKLQEEVNS